MKIWKSVIAIVLILACSFSVSASGFVHGDADGNDKTDTYDLLLTLYHVNQRRELSSEETSRADVDFNGKVDIWDIQQMVYAINGRAELSHQYTQSITKEATCQEAGTKTYTCLCGDTYTEEIPQGEHTWGPWVRIYEPTEYAKGMDKRTCSICKAEEKEFLDYLVGDFQYPIVYEDETAKITIEKILYKGTWCYVAHLQFTDYTRFFNVLAHDTYDGELETTSAAAERVGALFAVNGPFFCHSGLGTKRNAAVVQGILYYNAKEKMDVAAAYSDQTGILCNAMKNGTPGIGGEPVKELVEQKIISETYDFIFCPLLSEGNIQPYFLELEDSYAQRTLIGTNGRPGDITVVVTNGRYNDGGVSKGLSYVECAELLKEYHCNFGIALDGGGSSTMVFQGKVLNASKNNERPVGDFVMFK